MPDDQEARAQALYDPTRLDASFAWFTEVTHPTLPARTDGDFTLVVLTGAEFPQIDRLRSVLADLPQAKLVQMPPCRHRDAAADAIRAALEPDATVGAQIRMDDGHGVARDCVATSRAAWPKLICPIAQATGQAIALDHALGLALQRDAGAPLRVKPHVRHLRPAALALFVPRRIAQLDHELRPSPPAPARPWC